MTTYKEAGVDIEAADKAVEDIKSLVKGTFNKNVLSNLGSFGACYKFPKNEYNNPILVSSADGVGTKLKIAFFGASLIGLPYFVIQLYLFLAPGLYKNEKMALIPYLIATPFLFLISTLMVHYVIMPLALNFFVSMQIDSNIDNISIKLLYK